MLNNLNGLNSKNNTNSIIKNLDTYVKPISCGNKQGLSKSSEGMILCQLGKEICFDRV